MRRGGRGGLWAYRRIPQARVHAFPNQRSFKWYGEQGIRKFDHGNPSLVGVPNTAAGGGIITPRISSRAGPTMRPGSA